MLNSRISLSICILAMLTACHRAPQGLEEPAAIVNGVPWFDQNGAIINSHGSCIVCDGGRYWLFGEYKSDTTNAFPGFGCYSSADLVNWQFERVVLPVQTDGLMGPDRVGERVKVMRCPTTGKYVMLMHSDNLAYTDPHTAIAIADSINGDYTFLGPLTYRGEPIRKWDIGTFQDEDGTGYLLTHHGPIYRLADDYLSADTVYLDPELAQSGESPTMFRRGDTYYILYSHLTSWERNDNFYFTSHSISGPWTHRGLFCPEGSLTFNSQCTFVLPIVGERDTTFMYMGDRWSFPHQASCATQVWLPLTVRGDSLSIAEYWEAWSPTTRRPVGISRGAVTVGNAWSSNIAGESYTVEFTGSSLAVYGRSDRHGGYARISIADEAGKEYVNTLVDFYSLVPYEGLFFVSPTLPRGRYTLTVAVNGDHTEFYNKRGTRYGSDDWWVRLTEIKIIK